MFKDSKCRVLVPCSQYLSRSMFRVLSAVFFQTLFSCSDDAMGFGSTFCSIGM